MKLRTLGPNQTEVTVKDKTVFFSYNTPVAYHKEGVGFFKTDKKWSVTTSKHINQWLKGVLVTTVSQEHIEEVIK